MSLASRSVSSGVCVGADSVACGGTNHISYGPTREGNSCSEAQISLVDSKIVLIRDLTLQTVRQYMPIATLFKPELNIDLDLFVKDQMLMHQIAVFLASLADVEAIDSSIVATHFESSELLPEIKAMFKQDPAPYLALLYEACCDVINKKQATSQLKPAIEGRIYTLKNALLSQITPEAIRQSQQRYRISLQGVASIKEEGASFIREVLGLHLRTIKATEGPSFRENLVCACEELVPFVQKITSSFLRENGKVCPENPLRFRNPTGYNHHGLVAATIMETCLCALGYKTRLLGRTDLEPKATLATAHNVIQVTGPDNVKFLVDPSYVQFHMDICLDDAPLPTSAVLVLEEHEIDGYIEEQMMPNWNRSFKEVRAENTEIVAKLSEQDKILLYVIDKLKISAAFKSSDPEAWARKAFKRVWELSTYAPILADQGFQEIFNGVGKVHCTYDSIQHMNISVLAARPSSSEVKKRLGLLMKNPALIDGSSFEALDLISRLQRVDRAPYASLLNLDPRLQGPTGIEVGLNAYFCAVKKVVNPDGRDLSVIYGCSGADCTSVLLATDAQDFTFLDLTRAACSEFEEALVLLKARDAFSLFLIRQKFQADGFNSSRMRYSGASSTYSQDGKHHMNELPFKFLFGLKEMGVDLDSIVCTSLSEGVQIDFPWQYHGASCSRMRRITFVNGDITRPDEYPDFLKRKLETGFDIFYMKSAFLVPLSYPQFLPQVAAAIKHGGWLMTADKTLTMEAVDPEPVLESAGLTFMTQKNDEIRVIEELMQPPFDPLCTVPSLELNPPEKRITRVTGSDLTYWAIVNLRQKK